MDKKAIKILFKKYWGPAGWHKQAISLDEFDYAKSKGIMFEDISLGHDDIVRRARKAITTTPKERVVKAFVSSLTSRRLDLRSALSSYSSSIKLPVHTFSATDLVHSCPICAEYDSSIPEDLNVLNFERIKFGGVRHLSPIYIWLDLDLFEKEEIHDPTTDDISTLRDLFDQLSNFQGHKLSDAEKSLKFIKSNKNERVGLISALGYCGILKVPNYTCMYEEYVLNTERDRSSYSKSDWPFPTDLWLPKYGLNEKSIHHWFSDYL